MTGDRARGRSDLPVLNDAADLPIVCRKLRTKMAFGSLEGPRDWRHGDSTTAAYWCLRTMESAGPDDSLAHPHDCQSGRHCFAAPDGALLLASDEPGGDRSRG
jgi:hypothetical protein